MRTNSNLRSAAIFLTLAFGGFATADAQAPFTGALQGQETDLVQGNPPQQILVDGTVSGIATNLGRFTLHYNVTVTLPAGSGTGSAQLTAATGDMIFTTVAGQGESTSISGLNQIVEVHTITGGTGRFAGATGSFIVERLVQLNTQPALTAGSIHGVITSPSTAH